jgi:hypothetical protein
MLNFRAQRSRACVVLLAAVVASASARSALAQAEVYKCTDGRSTTYANTTCEKLGLQPSGAVRDRLTVIGNGLPTAKPETPKPPATTADEEEERSRKRAAGVKPVNPLIDRLSK